jgi:hypothetical protein
MDCGVIMKETNKASRFARVACPILVLIELVTAALMPHYYPSELCEGVIQVFFYASLFAVPTICVVLDVVDHVRHRDVGSNCAVVRRAVAQLASWLALYASMYWVTPLLEDFYLSRGESLGFPDVWPVPQIFVIYVLLYSCVTYCIFVGIHKR